MVPPGGWGLVDNKRNTHVAPGTSPKMNCGTKSLFPAARVAHMTAPPAASADAAEVQNLLVATLDKEAAIAIYLAKASRTPRDSTSSALAAKYKITMKAVRDVWNLRTWTWATMPYWTRSDQEIFMRKHLCAHCRANGVRTLVSSQPSACGPGPGTAASPTLQTPPPGQSSDCVLCLDDQRLLQARTDHIPSVATSLDLHRR